MGVGAGAWLVPAAAGVQPFRRRLGGGLACWGVTSLMLDWHLGMFETADGRPCQLGAADALTLARAWLVPVVADSPTLLVCAVAGVTDVLDGQLARRAGPTRAGRDLEGLVDACFSMAALSGLRRAGRLGRGPALAEGARLAVGLGYATLAYLVRGHAPDPRFVHAARASTAARFGGLMAAAAGRRNVGDAALVCGSTWSIVLTARTARRPRGSARARPRRAQPSTYPRRVPRRMREPATRK
jgi:phosphatidylglycerophosphate synthase